MKDFYCVIMAGGVGSRFWPLSRSGMPKQFIDILGNGQTLLQATVSRFLPICPIENILIVTNENYSHLVQKQLPQLPKENILCEPQRRNTAPCIAYACHWIFKKNPHASLVVAPSDHLVEKTEEFQELIRKSFNYAQNHPCLLTLGIKPTRPDSGYGYIQMAEKKENGIFPLHKVKTFTEKPNQEMAKFFLKSGEFLWNAGIFVWSLASILEALEKYLPEINHQFSEGKDFYHTPEETGFIRRAYSQVTNISIDYGIMEKAGNVFVVPADMGWSDLGTWGSLHENTEKDASGNAVLGKSVMIYDSRDNLIHAPSGKLIVIQGLENFIVVESEDALLICKKSEEQNIRNIVNDIKATKGETYI